ncbi:endonuclease/exonuclease/phosphatase family protein [Klenkia brasiliensis]|uniref:Metal-dependent hydrolase, endonuclease/exonuclease/phosphatase family n=1 Tax=Klenkia brasiliensis TaxID=333142 RepID=A0A1G7N9A9_9ACTN|nr:endonuclease/exonuclease/phosphatase family protein [Klenkia brasiliensis]SDF69949.1 Metal-dependent hydrolase, endonuclease/exonuclease/phosphatase family [Klenkia brasiliensis]
MRIVSLNAWCGVELDALLAWLPAVGADVLCLQEVTSSSTHHGWVTYADGDRTLRQRSDLLADVRAVLPGHEAHFVTFDTGPVVGEDGTRHRQLFGEAVFVRHGLPVVGLGAEHVVGDFAAHDEWPPEGRPRLAQAVRVVDPHGGRPVVVVHTHGVRERSGKGDTGLRRSQAERLAEVVERVRRPGDLVVLVGDLNLLPDSETFDVLAGIGLRDLVGTADTRTHLYAKAVRHASYALVSDVDAVRRFEVVAAPVVSDHRPLVLDLEG